MSKWFATTDWPPGAVRALLVLSVTQIIAWGTLFYGITLIGPRILAETGWSKTLIYGAFSLAMLCSGLIAPRIGGWIDANGGRGLMALGSAVGGLGYVLLALAQTPMVLYAAFAVIGIGMAGSLYDPAFASLARIAGPKARTAITMLTLGGGLASTVFWPLGLWLLSFMDWRGLCLVYAGLNGIICFALHVIGISNEKATSAATGQVTGSPSGTGPVALRGKIIGLLALVFMAHGLVSNGMSVHITTLLGALGLSEAQAVTVGTLIGPAQSAGRLIELALGGAYPVMRLGYVATGLLPVSFATLALGGAVAAVVAFAVLYGLSNGLVTIARGVIVLGVLGRENYGRTLGAIAAPTLAAKSVSPMAFAVLIDWMGAGFALGVMAACGVVAFGGMVALGIMLARAGKT
ncbi:MAG: MFS transporter [Bosea sp. (in: a-proteobacteria)]